jgi:hypothetical protein
MAIYDAPKPKPLPPNLDPLLFVLDIVGFILQLLGFGSVNLKPLEDAVNTTWTNLVFTSSFLYNAIHDIFDFLRKLVAILVDAVKHIIQDIIHGHLKDVLTDLQNLFHSLHDLFKPILDALDTLRKWYYKYIFRWIKLVEEILSRVRVVLALFRILGAKWAAKLDADIAKIQGYLAEFNQAIVGTLNQISTWLNIALDPFGIVRKEFFKGTLFSNLGGLYAANNFGKDRPFTASEAQSNANDKALITSPAGILTRNADGSVKLSDSAQSIADHANNAVDYYGRPGLVH